MCVVFFFFSSARTVLSGIFFSFFFPPAAAEPKTKTKGGGLGSFLPLVNYIILFNPNKRHFHKTFVKTDGFGRGEDAV